MEVANVVEVWDYVEDTSDSELDMAEGEFEIETSEDDTPSRPSTSTRSWATARHVGYDWEEVREGRYT